jgi:hypothetical protein
MRTPFLPLILAGLASFGPAPGLQAEDLPDSGVILDYSNAPWKVKLAKEDETQVGSIAFGDPFATARITSRLEKASQEFTIPPGKSYSIFFLDAPAGLTTKKASRVHRRTFVLQDPKGRKLVLESFRKEAPLSNVFIRLSSQVPEKDLDDLRRLFLLNDGAPGNITIRASEVPAYVPQ